MAMMARRLDDLGRITIPMEMRRGLGWGDKEVVAIVLEGNSISLTKLEVGCCICGTTKNVNYKVFEKDLCKKCKEIIVGL